MANGISGENKFKTSNSIESETKNVEYFATNFFGDPDKENVIVVDTPAIDPTNLHNIFESLKIIGYVHSFVIVINSQYRVFDEHL